MYSLKLVYKSSINKQIKTRSLKILKSWVNFIDRESLQLGSLSHFLNTKAAGYEDLPPFATEPQPSSVRDVEPIPGEKESKAKNVKETKVSIYLIT